MTILPDLKDFTACYDDGRPQLAWTQFAADLETPVSLYLKLSRMRENAFLLESIRHGRAQSKHRDRYSVVGVRPDLIWRSAGERAEINREARWRGDFTPEQAAPLDSLRALLNESAIDIPTGLPPMAAGLFGYLGYDMVRHVERLPNVNPDGLGLPDAMLIRPTIVAILDNVTDLVTLVTPVRPESGVDARAAYNRAAERLMDAAQALDDPLPSAHAQFGQGGGVDLAPTSNFTPDAYRAAVEAAKEYIVAGDIFQVVPSQRWRTPFSPPPFALYRALRRTNPSPYMFYFDFGGFQVTGASPEILVRVSDRCVTIRPIAGTRPRGADDAEDQAYEADLLADPKELAEHLMLLDLGRNDVGRVSKIGTVDPNEQFKVEYYSHVMHIVSNVEGDLRDDVSVVDALLAGMPAGTVSGAPKVRAMEIIDELEPEKRGVYAGGVGYFSSGGDMDTCIALRTAVIKDGEMFVQAGGGVVYDSDPEAERQETINKSKALMKAAEEAARFAGGLNRR